MYKFIIQMDESTDRSIAQRKKTERKKEKKNTSGFGFIS